jgi:hypothetical protein
MSQFGMQIYSKAWITNNNVWQLLETIVRTFSSFKNVRSLKLVNKCQVLALILLMTAIKGTAKSWYDNNDMNCKVSIIIGDLWDIHYNMLLEVRLYRKRKTEECQM